MAEKLNALAFGYAAAILAGIGMLLLGILGNIGIYTGAAEMMQQWHMFFSLNIGGIIAGIIEAAIIGFILGCILVWLYNKFV